MSSIRLTKELREKIAHNALEKAGVLAELADIEDKKHQLALDARIFAFGGKQKIDKLDALLSQTKEIERELQEFGCSAWFSGNLQSSIYLTVSGRRIGRCPYGNDTNGKAIYLPTPERDKCLFSADHEITRRFDEISANEAKIESRKRDIASTVWAALNSVSTVKRLIEVWPESKELLPDSLDKASASLPALKVEDLNRMIGLPTEQAA